MAKRKRAKVKTRRIRKSHIVAFVAGAILL
jgi:hypothetical protein